MSYSTTNFWATIQSPILFTCTISFFHYLSTIMPTPFLDPTFPVYQCLNLELSNSFTFSASPLVSYWHIKLIFLLVTTSTIFIYFQVRVPLFHVLKQVLLSWTNFFTHIRSERCIHPCSFNIVLELYNAFLLWTDLVFTLLIRSPCHRDSKCVFFFKKRFKVFKLYSSV
jgi:hypothetical protein